MKTTPIRSESANPETAPSQICAFEREGVRTGLHVVLSDRYARRAAASSSDWPQRGPTPLGLRASPSDRLEGKTTNLDIHLLLERLLPLESLAALFGWR